eukprot:55031_1
MSDAQLNSTPLDELDLLWKKSSVIEPGDDAQTFTWRIPSISDDTKQLLCHGFARTCSDVYMIDPIIELYSMYYSEDLFTLNDIQNSIADQCFVSKPFVIRDVKFYLELFPNGFLANEDYVVLFVRTPSPSACVDSIVTQVWLHLVETDTKYTCIHDFVIYPFIMWEPHGLLFADIKHLQSLTFKVHLNPPELVPSANPLRDTPLYVLPSSEYVWRMTAAAQIKRASNVACIKSPVFCAYGLKWYIGLWPNGSRESREGRLNLYLNLVSGLALSTRVVVQFILTFVELNATEPCAHGFVTDSNSWGIITLDHWPATKDIQRLDTFTFKVSLVLMDVYEADEVVTDKYRDVNTKYPLIEVVERVPMDSFVWKIGSELLTQMKSAANAKQFCSECFSMFAMKFVILCHPNGKDEEDEGNVNVMICLKEPPKDGVVVATRYNLKVIEAGIEKGGAAAFQIGNTEISWGAGRLSTQRIQNWDTFTIQLDLELVDVFNILSHS